MIPERYLLYLDILGFSEMAKTPERVLNLYQIMDRLHVHSHESFRSIVFSDTLLVYNVEAPRNEEDAKTCVMFLIEFAQDLLYRLIGRDYYFRAVLTKGEFLYHEFSHLDAFFGQALIDAYNQEKNLAGVGLFLDNRLLEVNDIFLTQKHCDHFSYVFLTQDIQRANSFGYDGFPFDGDLLNSTTMNFPTFDQIQFLADVYKNAREHPLPKVRSKFQATWTFYELKFPGICNALQQSNFDCNAVADADWDSARKKFEEELQSDYYVFNPEDLTKKVPGRPRR